MSHSFCKITDRGIAIETLFHSLAQIPGVGKFPRSKDLTSEKVIRVGDHYRPANQHDLERRLFAIFFHTIEKGVRMSRELQARMRRTFESLETNDPLIQRISRVANQACQARFHSDPLTQLESVANECAKQKEVVATTQILMSVCQISEQAQSQHKVDLSSLIELGKTSLDQLLEEFAIYPKFGAFGEQIFKDTQLQEAISKEAVALFEGKKFEEASRIMPHLAIGSYAHLRKLFSALAIRLIAEGKLEEAAKVLPYTDRMEDISAKLFDPLLQENRFEKAASVASHIPAQPDRRVIYLQILYRLDDRGDSAQVELISNLMSNREDYLFAIEQLNAYKASLVKKIVDDDIENLKG